MPARLAVRVCLALAGAVRGVDFARGREDQERLAVEVHVRIRLQFSFGFRYCRFPPAISRNPVEGFLCDLPHPVLIYAHHLRLPQQNQYQLTHQL